MQDYFRLDRETTRIYAKYSNLTTYKKLCKKVYNDLNAIIESVSFKYSANKAVEYSFAEIRIINTYTNNSYQRLLLNNLHNFLTYVGYEKQGLHYWK